MRTRGFPVMIDVSGTRIDGIPGSVDRKAGADSVAASRPRLESPQGVLRSLRGGVGGFRPGRDERQLSGRRFNAGYRARISGTLGLIVRVPVV
jgi:hypothetical protein